MPPKRISVIRLTPEERRVRSRRMRAVEEILLNEFDVVQRELDHANQTQMPSRVEEAVERYTQTLQRLRKFLTDGEVPSDVAEKLNETCE